MGAIVMYHERHGTKVAICELEALADEDRGWKRKRPEPPNEMPEDDELETLREEYKDRFGKYPHHKKNAASLRKELE